MANVQRLFEKVILNFQKFSSWCLKEERNWHFRDQNPNLPHCVMIKMSGWNSKCKLTSKIYIFLLFKKCTESLSIFFSQ